MSQNLQKLAFFNKHVLLLTGFLSALVKLVPTLFLFNRLFYYSVIHKCMETTLHVYFLLGNEIEYYNCHGLWFVYYNTSPTFSSSKLENGPFKQIMN